MGAGLLLFFLLFATNDCEARKPNIVIFMADDLGFGDVGAFGNTTLRTPNIDRLAREGLKLTHHLTPSPLCTPSRAAFLTGRLPIRLGMASSNRMRVISFIASTAGLPTNETTFAELAKKSGYRTGYIGKWHVGTHSSESGDFASHPLKRGFDYFYGCLLTLLKDFGEEDDSVILSNNKNFRLIVTISAGLGFVSILLLRKVGALGACGQRVLLLLLLLGIGIAFWLPHHGVKFLNSVIHRNFDVVEQPIRFENLTQRLVWESEAFMERHLQQDPDAPFLLFVSWFQVHTVLYNSVPGFRGRSQHGSYGDNVEEMDWSVGEVLKAMDRLGVANNTLVLFTSDNGGHVEERDHNGDVAGGFNGPWRGGKAHGGWDAGYRVPTVIRWPGVVPEGSSSDEPTSNMDFFPTFAEIFGQSPNPQVPLDGENMFSLLRAPSVPLRKERHIFQYCGDRLYATRWRTAAGKLWKLRTQSPRYLPGQARCSFVCDCVPAPAPAVPSLTDLLRDPEERQPLEANDERGAAVREDMAVAIERHQREVTVGPPQMIFTRLIWRPWLQPCCNFPLCNCRDDRWDGGKRARDQV